MYKTKDSGQRQQYETGMVRDTSEDKPRYDLVYMPMLKRWAELMGRGCTKYGERNWEKAATEPELARFKESAFRHFVQWVMDDKDEDHAAAVFFNISGAEHVKAKIHTVCDCTDERAVRQVDAKWQCIACGKRLK